MNSPGAVIGTTAESAAAAVTAMGFPITPERSPQTAQDVGETTHHLARRRRADAGGRHGAHLLATSLGGKAMMAFWYHFAILFEALFILTAVDAGTRAGRFMLQDLIGHVRARRSARPRRWSPNLDRHRRCASRPGAIFLYQGVTDPLGGVNTLWPLFGISNQMLAAIALTLWHRRDLQDEARALRLGDDPADRSGCCVCTLTAGLQKLFSRRSGIGFLAHAQTFATPRWPSDRCWRRPRRWTRCARSS